MYSTGRLSKKLEIKRSSLCLLEKSEIKGTITLEKLQKVAEAMDCELVYAIRPKQKVLYSQIVWQELLKDCLSHWWVRSRPANRKAQALGWIARMKFENPQYRREKDWGKNPGPKVRASSRFDQGFADFDL